MKINYKKIGSILASGIMFAGTIGFAAAASYPAPFVSSGTEDGAVVYGANAATSDVIAAIDIGNKLNALVTDSVASGASTTGGDSYKFEKASTKFHLGQGVKDIVSTDITEDNLPSLLSDGKYIDLDNDEKDYIQKITMANLTFSMFDDNDYKTDTPTIGFKINNGANVLNYTLDFTDEPTWDDIGTTTLPFMGKEYYVLTTNYPSTNTSLTLLDSAAETILSEGETTTLVVDGVSYAISISFIGSASVKLDVNGEITNSLAESATFKLADGAYVGIKDIMYTSKDTGLSKVEFSIGSGKLLLTNGLDVKMNDESISNLEVEITAGASLSEIKVIWKADDELFITDDSEVIMPGFKTIKLNFGGLLKPIEETIRVESGGDNYMLLKNFPLKDTIADINLLYFNGSTYTQVGKDSDEYLRTPGGTGNQSWTSGALSGLNENGTFSNITFDGDSDSYFVTSWNDSSNAESYLMRVNSFVYDNARPECDFQYLKDSVWTDVKEGAYNGSTFSIGNVELTVGYINKVEETVVVEPGSGVNFNTLFSKEGLVVYLPWVNETTLTQLGGPGANASECGVNVSALGANSRRGQLGTSLRLRNSSTSVTCNTFPTTYDLIMVEEDKNENKGIGDIINLTFGETTANAYVTISGVVGEAPSFAEEQETDIYRSFTYGELSSELLWDKSKDQYKLEIIYHGDETYGELFLSSPDATITPGTTGTSGGGQVLVVKDSEISSVASKNLIVVGGSCINTVAAKILGSTPPLCEAEFTTATGVGSGQYIIKTVTSPENDNKVAMLVAGYDASDTVNAVAKAIAGVTSDVDSEQVYPIVSA